jgi:hypothetical protein
VSFFPRPASLPQARPPCPSADPLLLAPVRLARPLRRHPPPLARPTDMEHQERVAPVVKGSALLFMAFSALGQPASL